MTYRVSRNLYFTDCKLMVQFSMFLCPLDMHTWIQRGLSRLRYSPFGKTIGHGVFFHQRAHNIWFSLFVRSAEIDTHCLDPLIYCGLENILILSFLFHLLFGMFSQRHVSPHL